jgi:hypothetical protein|tara:strand:+ start:1238 stop:1408 length:171 start_codon:yes stop_codon:yes gene_type:complete
VLFGGNISFGKLRDMMKLKASIIIGLAILIAYGILIHWRPYSNEGLFSYHDLWGEE